MRQRTSVTVALADLDSLDASAWTPGDHHRIDVITERALLPFLVVPRQGSNHVLILNNGAVDQHRAERKVVFQRSSWSEEINHSQIYFYDPATGAPDYLSLAWGQLSRDHSVLPDAAQAVQSLSRLLGVTFPEQRTYFGSSAGGFMALAQLAHDPGAKALINNAQFDWTRWMPQGVNPLRQARFENLLPTQLRSQYPDRTNVLKLLAAHKAPLRVRYLVNLASKHDRLIDYPMFHEFLLDTAPLASEIEVNCYFEPDAGHNPLPRDRMVAELNG